MYLKTKGRAREKLPRYLCPSASRKSLREQLRKKKGAAVKTIPEP
jgi:hypothetical protein